MSSVGIGLCGLGTVSSGVINVLARNANTIGMRAGTAIEIRHIGARRDNPSVDTSSYKVSRDIFAVVEDPAVDIVVELIGGYEPARELVLKAIANGKHVVTANKALIAEHGNEIFAAAEAKGVNVAFEAGVAGGIPIIKALREGLAGNEISSLAGIINGTGNFIMTEMRDKGRAFEDVLKEAQELGYAEADPTFDVEGIDAAQKLVILAAIAFGVPLDFSKAYTEGITNIDLADVSYAEELGYRIKHLGIARRSEAGIEMRVHPTLIPSSRLIANVNGVKNAVLVQGDAVGPTLYYGAGAGAEPTASAVLADITDVARDIAGGNSNRVAPLNRSQAQLGKAKYLPIDDVCCAFYLRLQVADKPGVLATVTQMLSDQGISIEALVQKEAQGSDNSVPLIMLTNVTQEKTMNAAIESLEASEVVVAKIIRHRVESLEG